MISQGSIAIASSEDELGGRRARILSLIRDAGVPLSVTDVATAINVHINTARFHLESLVAAGLAERDSEVRDQPGRRRIVYTATANNPNRTQATAYRLFAEILVQTVAARSTNPAEEMYAVGKEWGRHLTTRLSPFEELDKGEICGRIVDKLNSTWVSINLPDSNESSDADEKEQAPHLLLHHCPFMATGRRYPHVVCELHVGTLNGSLEELRSDIRVVKLEPQIGEHICRGWIGPVPEEPMRFVPLNLRYAPKDFAAKVIEDIVGDDSD